MRLYIWNKAFPYDWRGGLAFAIAETEDQARRLLAEKVGIVLDGADDCGLNAPADVVRPVDQPFAEYCLGEG
jgi:hypothetical protein